VVLLLRKERVQARELAEMFGVSVRTILRDVEAINLAGIPVVTYQGVNGGIGIAEVYRLDRSVLSADDMASLISLLRGVPGLLPETKSEVLVQKLKNVLTSAQLQALNAKANQLVIDPSPWGGYGRVKEAIALVRRAIEENNLIEFSYSDTTANKTRRGVEPYSLILKGQNWYLYGWCRLRHSFRVFKLSRIRELNVLDELFVARDVPLEQQPWEKEWQKTEYIVELELLFEKEMETVVGEWFGEESVRDEDGRILVKAVLPENNWLYGFLLSFGSGVEVVGPPHIRTIVSEIAREIVNKYY